MSWRNSFVLCALLLVSACGFEPMYGKSRNAASPALAGISISLAPRDRLEQLLKQELEDNLNPDGRIPANPPYRLAPSLLYSESAIGVTREGNVTRYNVYLDSNYVLYRTSDGKKVSQGSLRHVSSYNNVPNAYYSTYVAKQDSLERGITELSELYRQRMVAYLTGPSSGQPDGTITPDYKPALPVVPYNQLNPLDPNNKFGTPFGGQP